MRIGTRNTEDAVFLIAEIGNNHEGDHILAKELIAHAADVGADAVKFQAIVPERLVSKQNMQRILQLQKFQFTPEEFHELREEAERLKVEFLVTPFDLRAVEWLSPLVPAWKIASGDNDFTPLLERVAETAKPVIISMGLGRHLEAPITARLFDQIWNRTGTDRPGLAMLHCVASYPTPDDQAALSGIRCLDLPGVTPGYSDHTLGIKAAELAVATGARIIEKHFTIANDHSDFRDHRLSANPADFRKLVQAVRRAERLLGQAPSGPRPCETENLELARRSLAAAADLPAGSLLSIEKLAWIRPGSGIRPGEENLVLGKPIPRSLQTGELIPREFIEIPATTPS